jgi:long-subunit acyl-CoA synthetase (AMP-forming)
MDAYNASCIPYQSLRKVIIVNEEWTNENGLLTPTLKMKRNALANKYEPFLENIYQANEKVSWE